MRAQNRKKGVLRDMFPSSNLLGEKLFLTTRLTAEEDE